MVSRRSVRLTLLLWCSCGAAAAQVIADDRARLCPSSRVVRQSTTRLAPDASNGQCLTRVADDRSVAQSEYAWLQLPDQCNDSSACLTASYRGRDAYLAVLVIPPPAAADAISTPMQQPLPGRAPAHIALPLLSFRPATTLPGSASDRRHDAVGQPPPGKKPPGWKLCWFLGGMLLGEIICWKMLTNRCGKCPHCHHWFARVELDRLTLSGNDRLVPLLRRRRFRHLAVASGDEGGELSSSRSTSVRRRNQCSMCLHEWETTSRESRRSPARAAVLASPPSGGEK